VRFAVIWPGLAVVVGIACAAPLAAARAQQAPAAQKPPAAAPAPATQPAPMTDAEREAYIAKAWNEARVFGADNGAFFRP